MPVDAADVEQLRSMIGTLPDHNAADLSALESTEEVLGYVIAVSRSEGWDEVDMTELVLRAGEFSPHDIRRAERVLRPLGYVRVADMMRRIAGRRKHSLAPLQ
jgi:hypothetical protein